MPCVGTDKGKPDDDGFERPERGALRMYHSTSITGRLPNTDLNRRTVNRKESTTGPNRKKCTLHLLQEINYLDNSANEKPSSPSTPAFLQWDLHSKQPHPIPSSFSIK